MIFKKSILALSMSAACALASAAPATTTATAPEAVANPATAATTPAVSAAATETNLLKGVPAYLFTTNSRPPFIPGFTAYTPMTDGDRVHSGWTGTGAWTNLTTNPHLYVVDGSGAICLDRFGSCPGTAGQGEVDINTIVVYSRQDAASQQEPSDSATFTELGAVDFKIYGQRDVEPGVTFPTTLDAGGTLIAAVQGNNLVKRTITFPTQKFSKIVVTVNKAAGGPVQAQPAIVEIEAFNRPTTTTPAP